MGVKNFIISHANEFALIDDVVISLLDYLPPRDQSLSNQPNDRKKNSASKKISPPSKAAVDSISKKNNFFLHEIVILV